MNLHTFLYYRVILLALLGNISCSPENENDKAIVVATSSSGQGLATRAVKSFKTWYNTVNVVLFKLAKVTDPETTTEQNNMFALSVQHDGVKMFVFFKIVGEVTMHMWSLKFKNIEVLEQYSETLILKHEEATYTVVFKNAQHSDSFLTLLDRFK